MSVNPKLRFEIFKRDEFICQYCGRKTPRVVLELDHIIPRSKGGTDDEDNLTTSCWECNRGKGAELLSTVLKDEDIHDKTVLLLEREIQLQEYNNVRKQVKEREDMDMQKIEDHFENQFGYVSQNAFPKNIVGLALKKFSYIDIIEWIDYAIIRIQTNERQRDCSYSDAVGKYLGGILRNKINENRNSMDAVSQS